MTTVFITTIDKCFFLTKLTNIEKIGNLASHLRTSKLRISSDVQPIRACHYYRLDHRYTPDASPKPGIRTFMGCVETCRRNPCFSFDWDPFSEVSCRISAYSSSTKEHPTFSKWIRKCRKESFENFY